MLRNFADIIFTPFILSYNERTGEKEIADDHEIKRKEKEKEKRKILRQLKQFCLNFPYIYI